jgi:hypothetical protein
MPVLFKGPDVVVESSSLHPWGSPVVVTFSSFTGAKAEPTAFARPFVERAGFNAVYVIASRNHWWQSRDMEPALRAAREHLAALGGERVLYGSSMGAYGALLFARDLGASRIVAVSPQTHVSGPRSDFKPAWLDCLAGTPILRDIHNSLAPGMDVRILMDPQDRIDLRQFRHLSDHLRGSGTSITRYVAPFATHAVLEYLKRTEALPAVVSGLLRGDLSVAEFRSIVRSRRHGNVAYLERAAAVAIHRGRTERAGRFAAAATKASIEGGSATFEANERAQGLR